MGTEHENLLKDTIGGTFSNELIANEDSSPDDQSAESGAKYSERPEPFYYVSVDIKEHRSLPEALDKFISEKRSTLHGNQRKTRTATSPRSTCPRRSELASRRSRNTCSSTSSASNSISRPCSKSRSIHVSSSQRISTCLLTPRRGGKPVKDVPKWRNHASEQTTMTTRMTAKTCLAPAGTTSTVFPAWWCTPAQRTVATTTASCAPEAVTRGTSSTTRSSHLST